MSDNKSRAVKSQRSSSNPKKEQEENLDLDSGFVSSFIESGPINSSVQDSSDCVDEPQITETSKQNLAHNIQQQKDQEMDSAYIESGLLTSDMSKLEINSQKELPMENNNAIYFEPNDEGDT